ncbi:MAG: radical SAM protein [Candidatus Methanofastidiosia archaeon]|jgi:radical SAM protein with 4Fe4S-binding SPASM domain
MNWQHPPKVVEMDFTSQCNLACRHCRASVLDKSAADLTFEQIVSILIQVHSLSPNATLAVAGGEPLMRPDLKDILFYITDNLPGIDIELLTNGTLITQDNIDWLTETVKGFNVSMEGANPEKHDSVRGKGAFWKTLHALHLLVEKDVPVAVRMTYFHQGEDEPEKLMRFLHDIGVKMFNFRYLVPVGRAKSKKMDADQYQKLCERIWEVGKELNMIVGYSDPFPELLVNKERKKEIDANYDLLHGISVTGCSIAFNALYINPQGIVELCPYLPVYVADAKKEDLAKIWFENELLEHFRYSRSALEGKCGDCKYKFACGGCRGAASAMGNFLGEEPRCWHCVQEQEEQEISAVAVP